MTMKPEATIDDLARVDGKAEIVNGELVLMTPAGGLHGYAVGEIVASLRQHVEHAGVRAYVFGDNVGFIVNLPQRRSFSPDAALFTGTLRRGFLEGAPVFAVEVRSEEEYGPVAEAAMAAKRADYFAAGTLVVWDVDVLRDLCVRVFRSTNPAQPTIYHRGEDADAEPAVADWMFRVDALAPSDAE